jgi:pimeloyl-ACP methyl ester carboxylesterase
VWFRRAVITLALGIALLVYGVFPFMAAFFVTQASTRPGERGLTSTPAEYGAEYRDIEFTTSDGVRLSGWLLPGGRGRGAIVLAHGLARSRRELLERAIALWRLGYGVLLYDARNHGASGQARVTLGYNERLDAEAAVRYLRGEAGVSENIALFGVSMGAAASLMAAAETPEVAGVIADSSFLSLSDTVDHHIRLITPLPAFPLNWEAKTLLAWRGHFDANKLDCLDAVRRLGDRPAMFIAGAHDPRMPAEIAQKLHAASASRRSRLLVIEGPEDDIHGHAYDANPERYMREISAFLDEVLSK